MENPVGFNNLNNLFYQISILKDCSVQMDVRGNLIDSPTLMSGAQDEMDFMSIPQRTASKVCAHEPACPAD
jgi:hypothetical protein